MCLFYGRKHISLALCLAVLLSCLLSSVVAVSDLHYRLTNTKTAALHQLLSCTIDGWDAENPSDPRMQTGDTVYFKLSAATCTTSPSPALVLTPTVSSTTSAALNFVVDDSFVEGSLYTMCYILKDKSAVYEAKRLAVLTDVAMDFKVLHSIYSTFSTSPASPTVGQLPVAISFPEYQDLTNRVANIGLFSPFLVPCSDHCASYDTTVWSCASLLAAGSVIPVTMKSWGTTVTGTFAAPLTAEQYHVCFPYCDDADDPKVSYSVVRQTASFGAANPLTYSADPTTPQARMSVKLKFSGTGLSSTDQVKLVAGGAACTSYAYSSVQLNTYVDADATSTQAAISVTYNGWLTTSLTLQMCYSVASVQQVNQDQIWSSVYLSSSSTTSDFVIRPMSPYTMTLDPVGALVTEPFTITFAPFTGDALSATLDAAYLVQTSGSCTLNSECSVSPIHTCTLTQSDTSVRCAVWLQDVVARSSITLCACYKNQISHSYAVAHGTITLGQPHLFAMSPSSIYGGQELKLTVSGTSLSSSDTIAFVNPSLSCSAGTPLDTFSYAVVSVTATLATFRVVGKPSACGRLCILPATKTSWIAVIPQQTTVPWSTDTCSATSIYAAPLGVQYTLSTAQPRVAQTVIATYVTATGLVNPLQTTSCLKVVSSTSACIFALCDSIAICSRPSASNVSSGAVLFSNGADFQSRLHVTAVGTYTVCVAPLASDPFVPIQLNNTDLVFTFTADNANPSSMVRTPPVFRLAMSQLVVTMIGVGLSSDDMVRLVPPSALFNDSTCPEEAATTEIVLTNSYVAEGSSSTESRFALEVKTSVTSTQVHACHYLGTAGQRVASYVGTFPLLPANPSLYRVQSVGAVRAAKAISLLFVVGSGATLQPGADSVYFYKSDNLCLCDAKCTPAKRVNTSIALVGNSSATSWDNSDGFDNFATSVAYTICYMGSGAGSPTYLGSLTVPLAHPTFYSVDSTTPRVGRVFTVTVTTQSAASLNSTDTLILVPSSSPCFGSSSMNTSLIEGVTGVVLQASQVVSRSFVAVVSGTYRVCYRVTGETVFQEVAFKDVSDQYMRQQINVTEADPSLAVVTPSAPTANQLVTIALTCTTCTCTSLRLVAGTGASCWVNASVEYVSTNCLDSGGKSYSYARINVAAGNYTVCVGPVGTASVRVPNGIVFAAANPSKFTSPLGAAVYTNQGESIRLDIYGQGLALDDEVLLLPSLEYHCHDLASSTTPWSSVGSNLWKAWLPCASPQALVVGPAGAGLSVTWPVTSTLSKRFGDLLLSQSYCNNSGTVCTLQLCYRRSAATWTTVTFDNTTFRLFAANPSSLTLDNTANVRPGQYALAIVTGTELSSADSLYFVPYGEACSTALRIAITTAPGTVSGQRVNWTSAMRFTSRNSAYSACYRRDTVVTQVTTIPTITMSPYISFSTLNVTTNQSRSQYEFLSVFFTLDGTNAMTNVSSVSLVDAASECPYPGYAPVVPNMFAMAPHSSFADGWSRRITEPGGFYPACMTRLGKLYRVLWSVENASVTDGPYWTAPNPATYTISPLRPMARQVFNITISGLSSDAALGLNDTVQVINGSLYDCGNASAATNNLTLSSGPNSNSLIASGYLFEANTTYNMTLCYRRRGGTFATIPRSGLADRNIKLFTLFPTTYTTSPTKPQDKVSLNITILGANTQGELLTASDTVKLVAVVDPLQTSPQPSDCWRAGVHSSEGSQLSVQGSDVIWRIAAAASVGSHTLCYKRTGSEFDYAYVPLPGFLVISPRASPYGFTTSSPVARTVFSGERFYLIFDSTEVLSLTLSTSATGQDVVALSSDKACTTLITSGVDEIPATFNYSAPADPRYSLHLRARVAAGTYYVCVKRSSAAVGAPFYVFEAVGGPDFYVALTVVASPVSSYAVLPVTPRAWIPSVAVTVTKLSTDVTLDDVFWVAISQSDDTDSITTDACYLPQSSEATAGTTLLLNKTLGVSAGVCVLPFPNAGRYRLCFVQNGHPSASMPTTLVVSEAAPTRYSVPSNLRVGAVFSMSFFANSVAAILNTAGNDVHVHAGSVADCSSVDRTTNLAPGTAAFSPSLPNNGTFATGSMRITSNGTFFVCFQPFDQLKAFAVPRNTGGFVFSLGSEGPQSYNVAPADAYAGQSLLVMVHGESLSATDYAKLVDVGADVSGSYAKYCTAAAQSAGLDEGTQGAAVTFVSSTEVTYPVRVVNSSRMIVCYYVTAVSGWVWVPSPASFFVNPPLPVGYYLNPATAFVRQTSRVVIVGNSSVPIMTASDEYKLVTASPYTPHVCTDAAPAFSTLSLHEVSRNSTLIELDVCHAEAVNLTLCYRLSAGTWAAVPFYATRKYVALQIQPLPLEINSFTPANGTSRPLQKMHISFAAVSGSTVKLATLWFTLAALEPCSNLSQVPFVAPYLMMTADNAFDLALPQEGVYSIVQVTSEGGLIRYSSTIAVRRCVPCSFSPAYGYESSRVSVNFTDTLGNELSPLTDEVKLVAVTSTSGWPCDSSATQSLGGVSWFPVASKSNTTFTSFSIALPASSSGSYAVCYKTTSGQYAMVGSNLFTVLKPVPDAAVTCPSSDKLYAGQHVTINFTITTPDTYSALNCDVDQVTFVPTSPSTTCENASKTGAVAGRCVQSKASFSVWGAVLPHSSSVVTYRACYRLYQDTAARSVAQLVVGASNPYSVVPFPSEPSVGMIGCNLTVKGSGLTPQDAVYVVPNSTDCVENCTNRLELQQIADSYERTDSSDSVVLLFNNPLTSAMVVAVCYRRAEGTLARVPGSVTIAGANPTAYLALTVPRENTTVDLVFDGTFPWRR